MTVVAKTSPLFTADRLPLWGFGGAVCGLIADLPWWPAGPAGLLLLIFLAIGPGAVVLGWWADRLPRSATIALIPVVSFSVVMLAISVPLLLGIWSPRLDLLILAALTAGGAVWNGAAGRVKAAGR